MLMPEEKALQDNYKENGLYIHLDDGKLILINPSTANEAADRIWNDPKLFSDEKKSNFIFQRCGGCSTQDKTLCDGMKVILPIIEELNDRKSYDPVVAIFRNDDELVIRHTQLQHALEYIMHMMVTEFCTLSKIYSRYYHGVKPLMQAQEVAEKIFFNIMNDFSNNFELSKLRAKQLDAIIELTSRSRAKRISNLATGDVLLNANANMALPTLLLKMALEQDENKKEGEDELGWKKIYELGIPLLDQQHGVLIEFLRQLWLKYEDSDDQNFPKDYLIPLLKHSKAHFHDEEELFKKEVALPFPEDHLQSHINFVERIESLINSSETTFQMEVLELVRLWVLEHILVYDNNLVEDYDWK